MAPASPSIGLAHREGSVFVKLMNKKDVCCSLCLRAMIGTTDNSIAYLFPYVYTVKAFLSMAHHPHYGPAEELEQVKVFLPFR